MFVAVSLVLGWLRVRLRQAEAQRVAVSELDGGFYYAHENGGQTPKAEPPGPRWLRRLFGDDFFQRPDWMHLNGQILSPKQWRHLESLRTLRVLYLCSCELKDEHLNHLYGLKNLEELHIYFNDDLSLEAIKKLQSELPGCRIDYDWP